MISVAALLVMSSVAFTVSGQHRGKGYLHIKLEGVIRYSTRHCKPEYKVKIIKDRKGRSEDYHHHIDAEVYKEERSLREISIVKGTNWGLNDTVKVYLTQKCEDNPRKSSGQTKITQYGWAKVRMWYE